MFRKLMLVAFAATGLALVGLADTANADHRFRRHHHHGFRGGYGAFCPDRGFGYGPGFYGDPYFGGGGFGPGFGRGFYRQPVFSGYRNYGFGGTGVFIQGRNFGLGYSRW